MLSYCAKNIYKIFKPRDQRCMLMAGDYKGEDQQLKAVYFAAGVAAIMACIERAVVVSVFMHWRVWVFLVLNLLLLAILFTSKPKHRRQSMATDEEDGSIVEFVGMKTSEEDGGGQGSTDVGFRECSDDINVEHETKKNAEDDDPLSKEELNHRADAFIAMFRQHLVTDAQE